MFSRSAGLALLIPPPSYTARNFFFSVPTYDHELQKDALVRQDLYPLAADALGRVMVCTMLMAGGLKDRETFQLTFSGSGPLGGVVAISDGQGGVRGYVTNGKVRGSIAVGFVSGGGLFDRTRK